MAPLSPEERLVLEAACVKPAPGDTASPPHVIEIAERFVARGLLAWNVADPPAPSGRNVQWRYATRTHRGEVALRVDARFRAFHPPG